MMVVSSLSDTTRRARPRSSIVALSSLRPISSEITVPPVRIAISCSMALRRSPKPGALIASTLIVPRSLLTTSVASASPSTSSAMITRFLVTCSDLLQHRQDVADRRDLLVGDQDVGLLELGLHALGVGDEVGRDVAAVDLHALGVLGLEGEALALLDRDHAVLADLLHHLGDQVADLAVGGRDRGDVRDVGAVAHRLGQALELGHQRLGALVQAALEQHRVGAGGDQLAGPR